VWQGAGAAHARSGDPAVLTGYMGKSTAFEDALAISASLMPSRISATMTLCWRNSLRRLEARTVE